MSQPPFFHPPTWQGRWGLPPDPPPDPLMHLRRLAVTLAVGALVVGLVVIRLAPQGGDSPHELLARPLNLAIAWADLNLDLGSEAAGAVRAVTADPELDTPVGRHGAHWLATGGSPDQRLTWATRLARRNPTARPLLQAAIETARCAHDPGLRKRARAVAKAERLPLTSPPMRRPPC
jgi:hypothetical protein